MFCSLRVMKNQHTSVFIFSPQCTEISNKMKWSVTFHLGRKLILNVYFYSIILFAILVTPEAWIRHTSCNSVSCQYLYIGRYSDVQHMYPMLKLTTPGDKWNLNISFWMIRMFFNNTYELGNVRDLKTSTLSENVAFNVWVRYYQWFQLAPTPIPINAFEIHQ